jgi:Ca-activated chloride channel family protein
MNRECKGESLYSPVNAKSRGESPVKLEGRKRGFAPASISVAFMAIALMTGEARAVDLLTSENDDVTEGNKLLDQGKAAEALKSYDSAARSLPNRPEVHLNRGLALSRMGDDQLSQAMQAFQLAGEEGAPDAVRARALANLGSAFYKKEDYAKAAELYKSSLMLAPGNRDVAWNLELAVMKKKEQEEKQKQDKENQDKQDQQQDEQQEQQNKQNRDQQSQDKQRDQDKKEQEKQEQEKQKQDKKESQQQKDEPKDQQQQQEEQRKPQPKTRQEVEQVLDSLDDQQKNLMKQMAEQKGIAIPKGKFKDW